MSGSKTGAPTIIVLVRHICRLVNKYGAGNLSTLATPEFAEAVLVLVAACAAFEALDDFPGQVDVSGPVEDIDITPGA